MDSVAAEKKTIEVCDPEGDLGTTAVIGGFYTEADQLYDSYIEAFALERKRCFYEYSGVFYVEDATEEQQENGYLLQNDDFFIQRLVAAMRQNQRSLVKRNAADICRLSCIAPAISGTVFAADQPGVVCVAGFRYGIRSDRNG